MSKSKNEIKNTSALEFIIPIAVSFVVAIIVSLFMKCMLEPDIPKNMTKSILVFLFPTCFCSGIITCGLSIMFLDFIKKDK